MEHIEHLHSDALLESALWKAKSETLEFIRSRIFQLDMDDNPANVLISAAFEFLADTVYSIGLEDDSK